MARTRVSVIIPCYNHARYLPEAVASVVGQTFREWEIVVVDDGSADDTAAVAERLIAAHPERAMCLLRQPNRGVGASRNAGIRAARGEYILPLDADDTIEPELLAETIAVLDARPELGFVYTDVRVFGEQTSILSGGSYSLAKLRFDCLMLNPTLFRKRAWDETGGFCESMRFGYEDWDFWLSLANAGWSGWHIARPLVRYRRSGGSRITGAQRHDLELRAQIILNHPRLYEPGFVAWARMVCSPAYSADGTLRSSGRWLRALAGYAGLIARYRPGMLPKILLRPLFWRLPLHQQGYARRLARLLRMSHGG